MMIYLVTSVAIIAVLVLAGIAGYVGWYLSHKSFNDGFRVGFETGFNDCATQMNTKPKNPLRPV